MEEECDHDMVSECCGKEPHEYVDDMCSSCNEVTGWICGVCNKDIKGVDKWETEERQR